MSRKVTVKLFKSALIILFLLTAAALFARAGGAGGDSGGGSGGGDGIGTLIYILIRIILELPFPANVITASIVIAVFLIMSRQAKKKVKEKTILNQLPTGEPVKKIKGYDKFIKRNPGFDEIVFMDNVRSAFTKIQTAWESQNLSEVRKFISDGVYQRFTTQFRMMELLEQTNRIDKLDIKNVYIDKIESDGSYDIIHTAVHASMRDRFESKLDPSLNSGGDEEFVEYWSFLKKRGTERVDIYSSDSCPNCGAPLPEDMGEVSRCASCGTLTNSGEYDWVLSEITQADDYISVHPKFSASAGLTEKVRKLIDEDDDFAVQLLEDKAGNGYLQILSARALGEPSMMRRFVSDNVFDKVEMPEEGERISYNRIYLNDVYLLGVSESDNKNVLHIGVKSTYQRVSIKDGRVQKIDQALISRTEVVMMSRDKNASVSKGSLYAHCCPSCGAPVEDSLKMNCDYCGSAYNSTSSEWIITDLMSLSDYSSWAGDNKSDMTYSVSASAIDKLYDVRDFAFNNVMLLIAADGEFSQEEKDFAEELASKWGYNSEKLQPFFNMALSGQLAVKMPEDKKKQKKIYKLMEKAALADRNISQEEQDLLDWIVLEYRLFDGE